MKPSPSDITAIGLSNSVISLPKSSRNITAMSIDPNTPLFVISDRDDVKYEDDPAMTQAKANLVVMERMQQERAEQRRLEREE